MKPALDAILNKVRICKMFHTDLKFRSRSILGLGINDLHIT